MPADPPLKVKPLPAAPTKLDPKVVGVVAFINPSVAATPPVIAPLRANPVSDAARVFPFKDAAVTGLFVVLSIVTPSSDVAVTVPRLLAAAVEVIPPATVNAPVLVFN